MSKNLTIQDFLVKAARLMADKHSGKLRQLKAEHVQLDRPEFVWHYLLQSFATMGRASGWHGLIGNKANYNRLRFETLALLSPGVRRLQVQDTCRGAKIRMPGIKAGYILECFEQVRGLGGPEAAKEKLLAQSGREGKIAFLKSFRGIGDKYARNIMMDVYHPEFRTCIAVDARIKALSTSLNLTFVSYHEHEEFYLAVARAAGINGWELDRLIFNFQSEFLSVVNTAMRADRNTSVR